MFYIQKSLFENGFALSVKPPNYIEIGFYVETDNPDGLKRRESVKFYDTKLFLRREIESFVSFFNKVWNCHEVQLIFECERPVFSIIANKNLRYLKRKKGFKTYPERFFKARTKSLHIRKLTQEERSLLEQKLLALNIAQKLLTQ